MSDTSHTDVKPLTSHSSPRQPPRSSNIWDAPPPLSSPPHHDDDDNNGNNNNYDEDDHDDDKFEDYGFDYGERRHRRPRPRHTHWYVRYRRQIRTFCIGVMLGIVLRYALEWMFRYLLLSRASCKRTSIYPSFHGCALRNDCTGLHIGWQYARRNDSVKSLNQTRSKEDMSDFVSKFLRLETELSVLSHDINVVTHYQHTLDMTLATFCCISDTKRLNEIQQQAQGWNQTTQFSSLSNVEYEQVECMTEADDRIVILWKVSKYSEHMLNGLKTNFEEKVAMKSAPQSFHSKIITFTTATKAESITQYSKHICQHVAKIGHVNAVAHIDFTPEMTTLKMSRSATSTS